MKNRLKVWHSFTQKIDYYQKNIVYVTDFIDETGNFIKFDQLKTRYHNQETFLVYYRVKKTYPATGNKL